MCLGFVVELIDNDGLESRDDQNIMPTGTLRGIEGTHGARQAVPHLIRG